MVSTFVIKNDGQFDKEIFIDPSTETFILLKGEKATITFDIVNPQFNDDFNIEISDTLVVLFETRQHKISISIDNNVVFTTSQFLLDMYIKMAQF